MSFVAKRRKNTWTIDHDGGNNLGQTTPYMMRRKDSTKSVIPSNDYPQ